MRPKRTIGLSIVASALAISSALAASNATPARIGNIWGGFDHQPTESQIQSAELVRGVAPNARERVREEQIVRQLNQELLKSVGTASTGVAPG